MFKWTEDLKRIDELPLDDREEAIKVNKKFRIKILILGGFSILSAIMIINSVVIMEFIKKLI